MKRNYLFAGLTVIIWATMATIVKLLLSDVPDLEVLFVSSLFAFVFMTLMNLISGKMKRLKEYRVNDIIHMACLGFLGLFLYSSLYYKGIELLTSQEAGILNYLWPIIVVCFSCIILKERFTFRKILAMALSFTGVIVLVLGNSEARGRGEVIGVVLCIMAAVCYGLFSVLNKKAGYDQHILMMITWFVVMVSAFVLGSMTEHWVQISGMQWIGLIWLGVVIDAVAYLTWAIALNQTTDTAKIANLAYLTPFLSIVISAIVLKETVHISALVALLLIVGGIMLQSIKTRDK